MDSAQLAQMKSGKGFIAALDQSGGSTPKALSLYGIEADAYSGDEAMFDLVHQMRTRIIKSPAFTSERVIGVILFEMTMDRMIDGMGSAEYLWQKKKVVPFLKVDNGLADEKDGAQVMKLLNIKPSAAVGKALDYLLELRLEYGPLGEERATEELLNWWSKENPTAK